jgi:hypothetical protein
MEKHQIVVKDEAILSRAKSIFEQEIWPTHQENIKQLAIKKPLKKTPEADARRACEGFPLDMKVCPGGKRDSVPFRKYIKQNESLEPNQQKEDQQLLSTNRDRQERTENDPRQRQSTENRAPVLPEIEIP